MEPVQMWGMVCILISAMSAQYGRIKTDESMEPRLPKLLTKLEALIASVGLYGFFMVGIYLIFLPLML